MNVEAYKATVNINQQVSVVLTDRGAEIANEAHNNNVPEQYRKTFHSGDKWTGAMWLLMEVFGPSIHMTCSIPFQGNEIEIKDHA